MALLRCLIDVKGDRFGLLFWWVEIGKSVAVVVDLRAEFVSLGDPMLSTEKAAKTLRR
jgi:hypothetical protein